MKWPKIKTPEWLEFPLAVRRKMDDDYIGLIAAGIAFYFLLASFPALAAAVSLYGLFSDPLFIADQFALLSQFLPAESLRILENQARTIASADSNILSFSFFISLLLTLYSATKGIKALIKGFNIAYDQEERRNFITLQMATFLLTFILMVYTLMSLVVVVVVPTIINIFPLPEPLSELALLLRWPLLFITALIGLEILYNHGPSRDEHQWNWVSPGSFIATLLWMVVSYLFSLFVSNFGEYNQTYGSLSAVIILLLWFWLSALMILVGAEINGTRNQMSTNKAA